MILLQELDFHRYLFNHSPSFQRAGTYIKVAMKDVRHYFELAQPGSSIRLCLGLQRKFPDLRGKQLELMKCLCLVANNSENYIGVCEDAWLRTTISLNSENDSHHIFSAESIECREMARMVNLINSNVRDLEYGRLIQGLVLPEIPSEVEIRSNILPGGAYLERLQELERQSCWTKVQTMLMRTSCCISRRGFFPKSILYQACEAGNVSLTEKVNEWRSNGGRCDLKMHLQNRDYSQDLTRLRAAGLQKIPIAEVKVVLDLGKGNEGSVYQVLWRNSTYAMKSSTTSFKREHDVALRVLHPDIVTAFGCSVEDDVDAHRYQGRCLLMEAMSEDLFQFAVKNDACNIKAPFSRVDSLDVLLQVGMAMDYMHTNNVVHGDLKPHNILISHFEISGNLRYFLAKVTDFGCAQFTIPGENLRVSGGFGTNAYSAPEVLGREREFKYPEKMDVYSFGAVAYEVLTGHEVHDTGRLLKRSDMNRVIEGDLRPSNSEVWKTLIKKHRYPLELTELVEKCWELRPEYRPSFSEICRKLKECKSTVQRWEKLSAAFWNIVTVCLFAFICECCEGCPT